MQPQTFGVPPPPQVCGAVHAGPQLTVPPHPSSMVPQFLPAPQEVIGVQPHTLLAPQTSGAWHVPHVVVREVPQLSVPVTVPQFLPRRRQNAASLSGVQQALPAVHTAGGVHVPQLIVPPQPLGAVPQFWPPGQEVAGVQPQTLGVPPPPHV